MTTKLMSDARQTQMVEATRKAAELHLGGLGASEAVAKCAGEIEANPHVLQRMVEAFNTAKTLAHFKSADAHERADTFEMADYDTARKILFPEGETAKAARSFELELGEIPDPFAGQTKAAQEGGIPDVLQVDAPVVEMSFDRRYALAFQANDRYRKQANEHRAEGERFQSMYVGAVQKLAELFRRVDRPDWAGFEAETRQLHKEAADRVLDAVWQQGALHRIKLARATRETQIPVYINTETEAHKLFKIAMYASELADEEFATSQKLASAHEENRAELLGIFTEKRAFDPLTGMLAYGAMSNAMDQHMENMVPKEKPTAEIGQDVGVESELSKAKLQATVRDLMDGDDVVSRHAQENPQAITQAVRDLTRMSPEIAQNPMLLRGALRRQLEMGQLEPFELKQIQDVAKPATGGQK